jgi:uncharacterized protein YcgI (DUF1989 family)
MRKCKRSHMKNAVMNDGLKEKRIVNVPNYFKDFVLPNWKKGSNK